MFQCINQKWFSFLLSLYNTNCESTCTCRSFTCVNRLLTESRMCPEDQNDNREMEMEYRSRDTSQPAERKSRGGALPLVWVSFGIVALWPVRRELGDSCGGLCYWLCVFSVPQVIIKTGGGVAEANLQSVDIWGFVLRSLSEGTVTHVRMQVSGYDLPWWYSPQSWTPCKCEDANLGPSDTVNCQKRTFAS